MTIWGSPMAYLVVPTCKRVPRGVNIAWGESSYNFLKSPNVPYKLPIFQPKSNIQHQKETKFVCKGPRKIRPQKKGPKLLVMNSPWQLEFQLKCYLFWGMALLFWIWESQQEPLSIVGGTSSQESYRKVPESLLC